MPCGNRIFSTKQMLQEEYSLYRMTRTQPYYSLDFLYFCLYYLVLKPKKDTISGVLRKEQTIRCFAQSFFADTIDREAVEGENV